MNVLKLVPVAAALVLQLLAIEPQSSQAQRIPNFLVIIADDMGYSDAGCYGGEIATPNLDSLAAGGLRFTDFYNTARCWPTRAALLTGYYPQQVHRDGMPGADPKKFGGNGTRPDWAITLAERLSAAGYRAYHSGKWHVDGKPLDNGFDLSSEVSRGPGFFGDIKKRPAKSVDPSDEESFYLTTATAQHAIECLQSHALDHPQKPFFHYLAFNAPHFPLHALPEDIERYRDRYVVGWDNLRNERHARQQQLGMNVAALSALESEIGPPYDFPEQIAELGPGEVNRPIPWLDLNEEQQRFQATKMAIHAAMIDRMDREIGRVLEQLRSMQALDNTFVCFLSDNGASAEIMVRGNGHDPQAAPGSASTYLCLGPGFSSAANTPFRRHKTWVHEGGISTPFIVHWPSGISAKNELRSTPAHVIDILPTILDLAGVEPTLVANAPPLPGTSLRSAFTQDVMETHDQIWFYHEGSRALRMGKWKIVDSVGTKPFPWGGSAAVAKEMDRAENWALYDLQHDRAEQQDLSESQPEQVRVMRDRWFQMRDQFLRDAN